MNFNKLNQKSTIEKNDLHIIAFDHKDSINNWIYTGQMIDGCCDGIGRRVGLEDNMIAEGQFKANKFHGIGRVISQNGDHYEGEFNNNLPYGEGKGK
jgi:hypothetical protein